MKSMRRVTEDGVSSCETHRRPRRRLCEHDASGIEHKAVRGPSSHELKPDDDNYRMEMLESGRQEDFSVF